MRRSRKIGSSAIVALLAMMVSLAMVAAACGGDDEKTVETIVVEKEVPVEVVKEVIVEKQVPVEVVKEVIVEKEVEVVKEVVVEVEKIVEVEVAPAEKEPVELTWWWWGEDQSPGMSDWADAIVPIYEAENPHITIEAVLLPTDSVIPNTIGAVTSQQGPDIGTYWAAGIFIEDMTGGQFLPLEELIPEEVAHYLPFARNYATYEGHVYGVPYYSAGYPWVYNKALWEEAGLDRDFIPKTWDELLEVGAALNAAGITPMGAGMKDQWFADWPWLELQPVTLESERDYLEDFLGITDAKMTDPKYLAPWEKLQELIDNDFFDESVNSIGFIEGWDMVAQGTAAMTMAVDAVAIGWERDLGEGNVGIFTTPVWDDAAHGAKYQSGTAYQTIYHWSENPQEAADFLAFTHRPDIMKLAYELSSVMTMDDRFEREWLDTPVAREIYDLTWDETKVGQSTYHITWPSLIDFTWSGGGALFQGEMTPLEVAELSQQVLEDWRRDFPEVVEGYKKWLETSGY